MSKKIPQRVFSIFLGLLNVCLIVTITWASYRGFELSDESFYRLGYKYFDHVPNLGPSSFHIIYGRFFSFLNLDLIGVRLLRLVLTLMAAVILYIGMMKLKKSACRWENFILLNLIVGGLLLGYAWAPMALSYNSMSSILIALVLGFSLIGLGSRTSIKMACWVILGGLYTLLFFIKATNLLVCPIITLGALYWNHSKGWGKKQILRSGLTSLLACTIGVAFTLVFISKGVGSIQETVATHLQQLFGLAENDSSHSLSYLWSRYRKNAEMVIQELKYPMLGIFIFYLLIKAYFKINKERVVFWSRIAFPTIGVLVFIAFIVQHEYWKGGTPFKDKMLIPYIFAVVLVLLNRSLGEKRPNIVFLLMLLGIPLAGAIGTNNGLSAQVLFYSVFIFLMIYHVLNSYSETWFKYLIFGIVMLLTTAQTISGLVQRPYRLPPLAQSTLLLEDVPTLKSLKVDSTIFELSENLRFLKPFKAEYIFAYSGMIGINDLVSKKPYSLEWFNEGDDEKICNLIDKSEISPENILFIIPEKIPLTDKIIACLAQKNILFTTDYSKIKSFEFFYPRSNKKMMLNVYQYIKD